MELQLYDTLTRKKRAFEPLDRNNVRMYVCGPTVYDFAHIGNARPVIVFDVLFRLLRHLYGADHVTYVRNITDVDDKINARAAEEYPDLPLNEAIRKVTEKTERQFHEDVAVLGCLKPTVEPRATEHIDEMKALIERMIVHGCAYVASDHVLFDVKKTSDYGALSKRSLDEMVAGARVEVAPYKRDPMDFVLWKPSKPGEPAWSSPAGIAQPGRPGWHIECSAMSWKHLGETFDIHGGGIDLVFPHHENEIAQSRCAFHSKVMANFWMHNGFLQVEGEKMSKSLGNFVTIRELLEGGEAWRPWPGEVIRLAMLATHYRQPIDFSEPRLRHWRSRLSHWVDCYTWYGGAGPVSERYLGGAPLQPSDRIVAALYDDLNTHEAIVFLDELAQRASKPDANAANELGDNLIWLGLVRKAYAEAYGLLIRGQARPDLLDKYEKEIRDARAIVLNQHTISKDASITNKSLATVRERVRYLNSEMKADGVAVAVSEDLVVSLEPERAESALDEEEVNRRIEARTTARKSKNFAEADRIRDELAAMGVVLHDTKDGTTWEIAR